MRVTLQHLLVWLASCLLLVALNVVLVGQASLTQAIFSHAVCGVGALWGIWRYHRSHHHAEPIAPLKSVVYGICGAVLLSLPVGYLFNSRQQETCTRTYQHRIIRNVGVVSIIENGPDNKEADFIKSVLKFNGQEHNWAPTAAYDSFPTRYWFAWSHNPMPDLNIDDLHFLSKLNPVGKCYRLFQFENFLDYKVSRLRTRLLFDLECRFGQHGATSKRIGSDGELVEVWWSDYEPLLRPLRTDADFKKAILDYRAGKNHDFDYELSPFATMVGLPP